LRARNLEGGEAKRQAGAGPVSSAYVADATARPWCVRLAAAFSAAHRYNISTTILQHFLLTLASAFWEGRRGAGGDGGTGRASLALAAHTTLANDTQKQI